MSSNRTDLDLEPELVEYIRTMILSLVVDEEEAESVKRAREHSCDHTHSQPSTPGDEEDPYSEEGYSPTPPEATEQDPEQPHLQETEIPRISVIIDDIISGIMSDDPTLQLNALRRLLSPRGQVPLPTLLYSLLDTVMDAKLVARVLSFLTTPPPEEEESALIEVSTWVISALARTEPKLVVGGGGIPALVAFLWAPSPSEVTIPAAYALTALASTSGSTDKRLWTKELTDAHIFPALIDAINAALEEDEGSSLNTSLILSLTRLAKSLAFIPKHVAATREQLSLIKPLLNICTKCPESEIIFHSAWGLYYLTKSGNERDISTLVHGGDSDIIPVLVGAVGSSLTTPTRRLLLPCLSLLGNVISSTIDSHTDAVLSAGLLPHLHPLLTDPSWTKEANWIVSNIAAGNLSQKEDLFQAGLFPEVMAVFAAASEEEDGAAAIFPGAKEATFTIVNVMDKGSLEQKTWFLDHGILPSLVTLLRKHPKQVLDPVRDAIYLLVKTFHPISEELASTAPQEERLNLQKILEESGTLMELSRYQDDDTDEEVWERVAYILDVGLNNRHSWHI